MNRDTHDTPSFLADLESPAPAFAAADAARLARERFGLEGEARPLAGERDLNFAIVTGEGPSAVLKIANAVEDPAVLAMQNAALRHVRRVDPGLPVPRVFRGPGGEECFTVTAADGTGHAVRLLGWVPGTPMADVPPAQDLRLALGRTLARLGRALRGFFHPAAGRALAWDIRKLPALQPLLPDVPDPAARAAAERVMRRFTERVAPRLAGLRAQVIFNDLNPDNVLAAADGSRRVAGVIDFGDLVHAPLVIDVAVACAYQLDANADDPLAGALDVVRGYAALAPLEPAEARLLPDLIAARAATTLAISSWRARRHPENRAYILKDHDRARARLAALEKLDRGEAERRFVAAGRGAPSAAPAKGMASGTEDLARRRARALGPAYRGFYEEPLQLSRGEGVWLYGNDERPYLDAYNNVPLVGHGHPAVVEAIAAQAARLATHTRYLEPTVVACAERLLATLPGDEMHAHFSCSGSEANELALRIARAATGNEGIIVTRHAYHGTSRATAEISTEDWPAGQLPAHVATVPAPDPYRGPLADAGEDAPRQWAGHVEAALAKLAERGHRPAALVLDTVLSSEGVPAVPEGCLAAGVDAVRRAGGLFIADEVQAGFGRTGAGFWGFERHGLAPDLVTCGKPMGNGYPVAVTLARRELVRAFASQAHYFNTFGGNPVACAAVLAVLDVMAAERLQENAERTGALLCDRLRALAERHPAIGDVRGPGLMIAVDLVRDRATRAPDAGLAARVVEAMRHAGVLIGRTGPHGNVLKIRPPLAFGPEHAVRLVDALDGALAASAEG